MPDPLDIIVKALEPYDIPTDAWSEAEKVEPAKAALAALESVYVLRPASDNDTPAPDDKATETVVFGSDAR